MLGNKPSISRELYMEPKKITLTCDVCGEKKTEFCEVCQVSVAREDGLLLNICSDCCQCGKREKCKQ